MPPVGESEAVISALKNPSFDFFRSSDREIESLSRLIYTALSIEIEDLSMSPIMPSSVLESFEETSTLSSMMARLLAFYMSTLTLEIRVNKMGPAFDALIRRFEEYLHSPAGHRNLVCDIAKAVRVDPAITTLIQPCLLFKGFLAAVAQRFAHHIWVSSSSGLLEALLIQSQVSTLWGLDLHPGAVIGPGVMFDHATGVVVGATAVIEGDAYILHGVTLGTSGKSLPPGTKRHPTVGRGVSLGTHAIILGDIQIGEGVTVGAGAVVTKAVPDGATVVGVNKILRAATAGAKNAKKSISTAQPRAVAPANKEGLVRSRL